MIYQVTYIEKIYHSSTCTYYYDEFPIADCSIYMNLLDTVHSKVCILLHCDLYSCSFPSMHLQLFALYSNLLFKLEST